MRAATEIARARATADSLEQRLSAGTINIKRRAATHTTVRACRFYAAALEFEVERGAAPAIEVASGKGGNPSVLSTNPASNEVRPFHGHTMERKHEQDPEKLFTEIGKSGDRGDALCHR